MKTWQITITIFTVFEAVELVESKLKWMKLHELCTCTTRWATADWRTFGGPCSFIGGWYFRPKKKRSCVPVTRPTLFYWPDPNIFTFFFTLELFSQSHTRNVVWCRVSTKEIDCLMTIYITIWEIRVEKRWCVCFPFYQNYREHW